MRALRRSARAVVAGAAAIEEPAPAAGAVVADAAVKEAVGSNAECGGLLKFLTSSFNNCLNDWLFCKLRIFKMNLSPMRP